MRSNISRLNSKSEITREPDVKRTVRPYTEAEARAIAFEVGEPAEYRAARLAIAGLIDKVRFVHSAETSPEGRHLAESGHFTRLAQAHDTFLRYFVNDAGLSYDSVITVAREKHLSIKSANEAGDETGLELSA